MIGHSLMGSVRPMKFDALEIRIKDIALVLQRIRLFCSPVKDQ